MNAAEKILARLDKVRKNGDKKWMARCPAHSDNGPSLSLRLLDDGRVLVHCFAGCGASDVMVAIGLSLSDLYPDGPHGEFMSKHREPETVLYKPGFKSMQEEIYQLRAKAGVK